MRVCVGKKKSGCLLGMAILLCLLLNRVDVRAEETTKVFQVNHYLQLADIVNDTWEEDFFGRMLLDTRSGELNVDGRKTGFSEEFGEEGLERAQGADPCEKTERFLEEQDEGKIYEVEETEGVLQITAPYQTKRLIVESGGLTFYYGAQAAYCSKETNETYLQFASEEDTRKAYEQITSRYGTDFCFVDELFYIEDVLQSSGDTYEACSWGVKYMGMDILKQQAQKKSGLKTVKVAVIDTGIDASNYMFADRVITQDSYNIEAENNNVTDNHGHGTHVSGTIVDATPDNVQIMAVKVANSLGVSSTSFIRLAINYAVEHNASVINISMGMFDASGKKLDAYDAAIQAAYNKKIPICVAAGNDSVDVKYAYPACNTKTFAVSALGTSHTIATYSNRGNLVDFSAPGSDIKSACRGGKTVAMSGTSMASPHMAAAAAYMKMLNPGLTVGEVYNGLKKYCVDLGESGKDELYGWGCPILTGLFDNGLGGGEDPTPENSGKPSSGIGGNNTARKIPKPVLKSVVNTNTGIQIKWKQAAGYQYYLYRKTNGGNYTKIAQLAAAKTSYIDKKVSSGKKYAYIVKAYWGKDVGKPSDPRQIIWTPQPRSLKVTRKGKSGISVKWSKLKTAAGYQIQYSKKKDFSNAHVKNVSGKQVSVVLKKLSKGYYYIRIRAWSRNGAGKDYSAWSGSKKVKVN